MANRKASIWLYAKVDGKWKYRRPAVGRNNKIKPEDGPRGRGAERRNGKERVRNRHPTAAPPLPLLA